MAGFYGQFLDTMGIEFEGIGLNRDEMMRYFSEYYPELVNLGIISFIHDASTEFFAEYFSTDRTTLKFSSHTKAAKKIRQLAGGNKVLMGYEVITSPLPLDKLEEVVFKTINGFNCMGDFTSERASTHFHIGFANNLFLLKNLLRVCLSLDPVLYRIGGMGDTFRGYSNRSAYARPLLHSVAVPITSRKSIPSNLAKFMPANTAPINPFQAPPDGNTEKTGKDMVKGYFAQMINPLAALEAKSIEQFWASFGVEYPKGGEVKYHPSRYTGCNFFSVPAHGTMEFRHANQTLNSLLIMALAKFLRATVEMSTRLSVREAAQFEVIDSLKEISTGDAVEVINTILNFCQEKEVANLPSDAEMQMLFDTLNSSSVREIPEMPVLCHISDFFQPNYIVAIGGLKTHEKVFAPKQVDIHNIKYQSLFPEGEI